MKFYKPVTIESAEQADALPAGTIWPHANYFSDWTALVPIEVEERTDTVHDYGDLDTIYHRYVTPWEKR